MVASVVDVTSSALYFIMIVCDSMKFDDLSVAFAEDLLNAKPLNFLV